MSTQTTDTKWTADDEVSLKIFNAFWDSPLVKTMSYHFEKELKARGVEKTVLSDAAYEAVIKATAEIASFATGKSRDFFEKRIRDVAAWADAQRNGVGTSSQGPEASVG